MSSYRRDRRRKRNPKPPNGVTHRGGPTLRKKQQDDQDDPPLQQTVQKHENEEYYENNNINEQKQPTKQTKEQSLNSAIRKARASAAQARHYAQFGTAAPLPPADGISSPPSQPLTSPQRPGRPVIIVSPPQSHKKYHDDDENLSLVRDHETQVSPTKYRPPPRRVTFSNATTNNASASSVSSTFTSTVVVKAKRVVRKQQNKMMQSKNNQRRPRLPPPSSSSSASTAAMSTFQQSPEIAELLARASSLRNDSQHLLQQREEKITQLQHQEKHQEKHPPPIPTVPPLTKQLQSPVAPTMPTSEDAYANILTAANRKNPAAQFQMGLIHERGMYSQVIDLSEALRWYSLSASQNNSRALTNVGRMYQVRQHPLKIHLFSVNTKYQIPKTNNPFTFIDLTTFLSFLFHIHISTLQP